MLASAYEPTAIDQWRSHKPKALFLTPRKVEARIDLRPGVAVSKEIGNCASAKIAENAHWTPKPRRLQAAAVAKREERVIVVQNVVGNKYRSARSRNRSNVQNKLVRILDTRRQTPPPSTT